MKAKIIAVGHKGGVSKTTTVANLGSIFARRGYKVLFVDLDLLNKIRLIASREGLQIKEVVNAVLEKPSRTSSASTESLKMMAGATLAISFENTVSCLLKRSIMLYLKLDL